MCLVSVFMLSLCFCYVRWCVYVCVGVCERKCVCACQRDVCVCGTCVRRGVRACGAVFVCVRGRVSDKGRIVVYSTHI